jgi:glycosyltransferase involved in cell wall biosynthesis
MERFSMVAADEVVYPSFYLKNEVERGLPQVSKHSRVVANPFQVQEGSTHDQNYSERRGFLFTAKIERRKGIEPLLSTFSNLWDGGLDEPLFLMGDDWYDEQRERWTSEVIHHRYGKYVDAKLLNWAGKQPPDAVVEKLGQVRAMVLPSLLENYPYAVLEAMAAGCPVIVSQSGGHTEIVEPGVSGLVFSHQKKGDLEDKIWTVLHFTPDEHASMVEAAQMRVKQVSGYDTIGPQKEEAFALARERMQPRKVFPFIRSLHREYHPASDRSMVAEAGLLSVVIPFFNLGNYLEDTLKSFTSITGVPLEIIVMDDGSTDQQSLELLNSLKERYQFRLERTNNQGLATTRNAGAHLARGEFLAFLDADDCMDPLQYQKALSILRKYENISFVGCWVEYFGDAQGYWPTWPAELPYALVHNPINTGGLVYRRADFLHYGLNDPTFAFVMEDYESMLSMLENGCRGVAIPEPYHKYRIRRDSMFHTTTDSSKIWIYQQLAKKHRMLFTACAEDIMGLINANGPGYLFDNPTLNYPPLRYNAESGISSNGRLHDADFTQVSAATLFYYAFRSILLKPYAKLSGTFPFLKKIAQKLKDELGQ